MVPRCPGPIQGRQKAGRASGFSLIELLVVLALLGVLATVTVPRLLETTPDDRLTRAASSVVEVLRSARAEALQRARPVVVTLGPTGTFAVRIESDDSLLTLTSGILKLPEDITLGLPDNGSAFRFAPSGSAVGDTLLVRDGERSASIWADRWTGVTHVR